MVKKITPEELLSHYEDSDLAITSQDPEGGVND